jgi:hypothetical protein
VLTETLGLNQAALRSLSSQQLTYFEQMCDRLVVNSRGQTITRLPVLHERVLSLGQKIFLLSDRAMIEPLDLLWKVQVAKEDAGPLRTDGVYHLRNVCWKPLIVGAGQSLAGQARVLKDSISAIPNQPLTLSEIIDLALLVPAVLARGPLLSLAGYSRGLLPELVGSPGGDLVLRIAQNPARQYVWLVPYGQVVISSA